MGAGLLAKKAVERGLTSKPWVKTCLAPGSRVVTRIPRRRGSDRLTSRSSASSSVGYGCTTCIGNSGPLPRADRRRDRRARPRGRVRAFGQPQLRGPHPSPGEGQLPCIASAGRGVSRLPGRADIDLTKDPLGEDSDGQPVYLKDLWPTPEEITEAMKAVELGVLRPRSTPRSSRARRTGPSSRRRPAVSTNGTPSRPTCGNRPSSTTWTRT